MRKTKKSKNILNFVLVSIITIFMLSSVQAAIESIKDNYQTTEAVSVKSTATPLCNNLPNTANVTLYIVENKDVWNNGDSLTEVREQTQEIPNSQFPSKIIWNSPKAGFYDIIVDCDSDSKYYNEPIDSFTGIGFTVIAIPGTGKAAIGEKNIVDHSWMYDSEEPDLANEMLQLSLTALGEDIKLENITIQASGNGDDREIDKLEIYIDENNNGKADENEVIIGDSQPAYIDNNGMTTIILDYILTNAVSQDILIVYQMKQTTPIGEYSLSVNSIYGTGESSGNLINNFAGLPINSGTKKVLPEKTCLGTITLELTPNPVIEGSAVKAKISGLTGCVNKTVVLKTNPCGSVIQEKIDSCTLTNESCDITFTALTSQTYHACVNKNEDNDMIDFGEYSFVDLIVNPKPKPVVNITSNITANITEEGVNITEEQENVSGVGITGGIIENIREKLSSAGSLLLILEATLLLIFIVLVVIAFRLKRPRA